MMPFIFIMHLVMKFAKNLDRSVYLRKKILKKTSQNLETCLLWDRFIQGFTVVDFIFDRLKDLIIYYIFAIISSNILNFFKSFKNY